MRWSTLLFFLLVPGSLFAPSVRAENPLDVGGVIKDIVADPVRDHLYVTLDTS